MRSAAGFTAVSALALLLTLVAGPTWAGPAIPLAKLDAAARRALDGARSGLAAADLRARGIVLDTDGALDVFIVGTADRAALEAAGARVRTVAGEVVTASVPVAALESVAALASVRRIDGAVPVALELDRSVPSTGADQLRGPGPEFAGVNGEGVVIGFVDTGIDYDHEDFLDADYLSRVAWLWDQTRNDAPPPAGYGYGSEWTREDMNTGLCTELATDGHGTHVAGIAAGDGSRTGGDVPAYTYVGMAPRAEIIMVKSTLTTTSILDGVAYVFERAEDMGKPAVVSLSIGTHYGPHDGTSDIEAGLSALTGPGRLIVKSAGNSRGSVVHGEVFTGFGAQTMLFQVSSGNGPGRYAQFFGVYESTESMSVRLSRPGFTGQVVMPGQRVVETDLANQFQATVENGYNSTSGGDPIVYIEVLALASINGTWNITYFPITVGPANGEVDLWLAGNSPFISVQFTFGEDLDDELITEPGNAFDVITTGAWTSRRTWDDCGGHLAVEFNGAVDAGNLLPFSSPGPTRDGRQKPDLVAPGSAIASAATQDFSIFCSTNPSTRLPDGLSHVMSQGTSMAAPHVAGALALLMQQQGPLDPADALAQLVGLAYQDQYTPPVWNKEWGHGKLAVMDLTAVHPPPAGEALALSAPAPNPTRGEVVLTVQLAAPGRIVAEVLDVAGAHVRTLGQGADLPAGRHAIRWDGRTEDGHRAAPGLYFVRVAPAARGVHAAVRRVVMLR